MREYFTENAICYKKTGIDKFSQVQLGAGAPIKIMLNLMHGKITKPNGEEIVTRGRIMTVAELGIDDEFEHDGDRYKIASVKAVKDLDSKVIYYRYDVI